MKSQSVGEYAASAIVLLFVVPVILWTVVHAGFWAYGALLFSPAP